MFPYDYLIYESDAYNKEYLRNFPRELNRKREIDDIACLLAASVKPQY